MSTNNCASVSKDDAFNIGVNDVIYQILKIEFRGKEDGAALKWEDLEKDVIDRIKDDMNHSFHVIMNNPMPSEELDNVIRELCNRMKFESDSRIVFSREDEREGIRIRELVQLSEDGKEEIFLISLSGLVSATYYIELKKQQ